ncbi:MAG: glucan biosynthesis protein, partial [Halomonas sp.]|nr:glucan biosynthesis protein [Halomonas sp.]
MPLKRQLCLAACLPIALPIALLLLVLAGPAAAETAPGEVDTLFNTVTEQAEALAQRPYVAGTGALPEALRDLDYDTYRQIRFRPEAALWGDEGLFSVQLFHTGFLFESPVHL